LATKDRLFSVAAERSDPLKNAFKLLSLRRLGADQDESLFVNHHGRPLSRSGIANIIQRCVTRAARDTPSLRGLIRSWLGHVSIATTNRYVEIDLAMKAKALDVRSRLREGGRSELAARSRHPGLARIALSDVKRCTPSDVLELPYLSHNRGLHAPVVGHVAGPQFNADGDVPESVMVERPRAGRQDLAGTQEAARPSGRAADVAMRR